ncbi:MAG: FeoA family protein [Bacteroidota bacterium]
MSKSRSPLQVELKGKGIISHFSDELIGAKMMAMGILPGSQIEFIRKSPFGGACYLKIDQQYLAVRIQEAACIVLT